jgi:hypothetical protein
MKVQLLMPCHAIDTVYKQHLFHKCLCYLDNYDLDRHAFVDNTVSPQDVELLVHHYFTIHHTEQNTEWGKVQEAYDSMSGPYIAICHTDDYWIEGKLDAQLKYIQKYPIVVTGYILNKDRFEQREYCLRPRVLTHNEQYGLVDCMPSTWLLNKTLVPTLPIPFFAPYCVDLGVLLAISIIGPIAVIKNSWILYNEHNNNQGVNTCASKVEEGRNALRTYAKTIPRPKLVYYWE